MKAQQTERAVDQELGIPCSCPYQGNESSSSVSPSGTGSGNGSSDDNRMINDANLSMQAGEFMNEGQEYIR